MYEDGWLWGKCANGDLILLTNNDDGHGIVEFRVNILLLRDDMVFLVFQDLLIVL